MESLAQNEPQLTNSSKNGKAWKDKKRKLLLLTKRHAMSSDLNHSRDTSHLSSLVSIQVEKDKVKIMNP